MDNDTGDFFKISSGSAINKQKSSALQGIISTLDLLRAQNTMRFPIGKCELFRIKHATLLEGETFLRNKHKIEFFFFFFRENAHFFLVETKTLLDFR